LEPGLLHRAGKLSGHGSGVLAAGRPRVRTGNSPESSL